MDQLIFHEDEIGLARLHNLAAFQYFDGYPNSECGALAMSGVWTAMADNTGLSPLKISLQELDRVIPNDLHRVRRVSSWPLSNCSVLQASAFAVDSNRAIVVDHSLNCTIESIWILHRGPDPAWVRPALAAFAKCWALLLVDSVRDFQFPLKEIAMLDAWLAAVANDSPASVG